MGDPAICRGGGLLWRAGHEEAAAGLDRYLTLKLLRLSTSTGQIAVTTVTKDLQKKRKKKKKKKKKKMQMSNSLTISKKKQMFIHQYFLKVYMYKAKETKLYPGSIVGPMLRPC